MNEEGNLQNPRSEQYDKKSKKWIWMSGIVILVLLIVGGFFGYSYYNKTKYSRALLLSDQAQYMHYKCLGYCPYTEVYTEWGQGNEGTPAGEGFVKKINDECLRECVDVNSKPLYDRSHQLVKSYPQGVIQSYKHLDLPYTSCLLSIVRGEGKSCMDISLKPIQELDRMFKEPIYENVTLNFTSISCSPGEINIKIDLIEGEIYGLQFILPSGGSSFSVERIESFNHGLNEIVIKSSEYSGGIGYPERVDFSYIMPPNEEYLNGWISDIYSSRLCNSNL